MACCSPQCSLITIITSIFICLMAAALRSYMPNLVEKTTMKNIVLSETSILYKFWVEPPIVIYTKFYVFNYTNSEQFTAKGLRGIRPKVVQLGPYVYRHMIRKKNITFIGDDEVEYNVQKELIFVPELSNGTEDDEAVFPNILLRAVLQSEMAKKDILGIHALLKMPNVSNSTFIRKSISSFIMDGYYDNIIDEIYKGSGVMIVPDGKFSLMNRVEEVGPIRINTGFNKTSEFGRILEYRKMKILDYWSKNSSCNLIKGTDGTIFPPRLSISEKVFIFSGDFCRSLYLRFEKQVEHHGLQANRFVLDTEAMSNTVPDHECFCQSEVNKCWGSGLFNIGPCKNDTPILLSQPHFLHTDFRIKNMIDGLAPNLEKHQFFMDLETIISLPLNISGSLQINFGIQRIPHIRSLDILPEIVLPLIWISEVVDLNETMTKSIKSQVIDEPYIFSKLVPEIIYQTSAFIFMVGVGCIIRHMLKATKKSEEKNEVKPMDHKFAY